MHPRSFVIALALAGATVARAVHAQGGAPPVGIRRPPAAGGAVARGDSAARPPQAGSLVRGVVFDSLASLPLVGAGVQLVRDDSARATRLATTDSLGSFAFPDVPPGRYLIGFFHPVLDSLEIDTPTSRIDVSPTSRTVLADLAVPSGERLRTAFCGARAPGDSSGALVGWLRDADSDGAIADGRIVLTWSQLVMDARGLRLEQRRSPAKSRASGFYVACDLPGDTDLLADADAPGGRRSGLVEVRVPLRGLRRLDVALADTTAAVVAAAPPSGAAGEQGVVGEKLLRGTARLSGVVRDANGRPVPRATVSVRGAAGSAQTSEEGTFSLGNLPAGTRAVQVRAIGYEPRSVAVRLASARAATASLVLDKRVDVLAPVTVVGKPSRASKEMTGFQQRRQHGIGTYLTRADIEQRSPIGMTDVLRTVSGLQVTPGSAGRYRLLGRGGCAPVVFVDGVQVFDGATDLDAIVQPHDVLGVEVYRGGSSVPAQFMTGSNSCATVVIWTGR